MTDDNEPSNELDEETRDLVEEVDEKIAAAEDSPEKSDDGVDSLFGEGGEKSSDLEADIPDANPRGDTSETGVQDDPKPGPIMGGMMRLTKGLIMAPISKLPKRTSIYQGMIKAGYQALYKNTSANVVVNTIYGDRYVIPRPAEIDEAEGKIRTNNGEEWTMPDGIQTYHIGDARMMWGVADAHELVSPVGARTAEKVDLGDAVYVQESRRGPRASQQAGAGQAVADGGHGGMTAKPLDSWQGEKFSDVLVNWANINPDADGMIVSIEKHYELQHSQAGVEEMKKQEDRGRLAERLNGEKRTALMYVALLLGGLAIGMFGPSLAQSIAGGDGGSSISLMAGPLLGW